MLFVILSEQTANNCCILKYLKYLKSELFISRMPKMCAIPPLVSAYLFRFRFWLICKAFYSAYWLIKEEISNLKFSSQLDMLKLLGLDEMKYFQYSSQGSMREIFLAPGSALLEKLLEKVKKAYCYGLLTDEVTDVSVMEMLITFIQHFDKETGQAKTSFLFILDVLKSSNSANAETIFTVITTQLTKFGLELQKCSSLVSDGAAVSDDWCTWWSGNRSKGSKSSIDFHVLLVP